MSGSASGTTQAQIIQVENLLRSFNTIPSNDNTPPLPRRRFDGRPIVAACLAFFVFAPGCAAAAAFLLRSDGSLPPLVTPDNTPSSVIKADRLPLEQWTAEAAERLAAQENVRQVAAIIAEDSSFLENMTIRGSLEDGALTAFANAPVVAMAASDEAAIVPPKRTKRHARRAPPVSVAEAAPLPEPPEPTFFEKLFGTRLN